MNTDTNGLHPSVDPEDFGRNRTSLENLMPVNVEHTSNEAVITKIQGIFRRDGSNASISNSTSSCSNEDTF